MGSREAAIARATGGFDSGRFRGLLAELVSIPSTAQDPAFEEALGRYLETAIRPWLERLGFTVGVHANPIAGFPPILSATRIEDPARPTVITYGHGDTVRGLDEQWSEGLSPWTLTERDGRWYGRGVVDNKGQHALNLFALEQVLAERGGTLGFNLKLVLEMCEERGSRGLREFVGAHAQELAADVLIGSDGPRVDPGLPSIKMGTRGTFHFDLVVKLRPGGVHSGHWGGITRDPAVILAHAITAIMDRNGKILVPGWQPPLDPKLRAMLEGCPVGGAGEESATIDEGWGEPVRSTAEKIYASNSFIVLSMLSGRPENPVNAVAPDARAHCQIRYTVDTDPASFAPALRKHLDAKGFPEVIIEHGSTRMNASRTASDDPWVAFAAGSVARSLNRRPQLVPNSSGGLPGDVFVEHLQVPLVWIPHSYNGCKQYGPDEHAAPEILREGLAMMAGLWWDLGETGVPAPKR